MGNDQILLEFFAFLLGNDHIGKISETGGDAIHHIPIVYKVIHNTSGFIDQVYGYVLYLHLGMKSCHWNEILKTEIHTVQYHFIFHSSQFLSNLYVLFTTTAGIQLNLFITAHTCFLEFMETLIHRKSPKESPVKWHKGTFSLGKDWLIQPFPSMIHFNYRYVCVGRNKVENISRIHLQTAS